MYQEQARQLNRTHRNRDPWVLKEQQTGKKKVLSRTKKGSLAVSIGEPLEEPLLVPDRTLSTEGNTWNPK